MRFFEGLNSFFGNKTYLFSGFLTSCNDPDHLSIKKEYGGCKLLYVKILALLTGFVLKTENTLGQCNSATSVGRF